MSTLDDVRAMHAAEIRVLELADELIAAKDNEAVTRELKAALREARAEYRTLRASADVAEAERAAMVADPDDEADATAAPATVETTAADGREAGR